jgi:hypothetical protein
MSDVLALALIVGGICGCAGVMAAIADYVKGKL